MPLPPKTGSATLPPPRLIVNADDFGLTPGINRAIAELHRAGVLSSATLMATGPAFADAVAIAKAHPELGVGCHLVFVDGIPVSHPESIPTLLGADGKTFRPSLLDFAQAALRGSIRPQDLARETQAQIQRLQRAGLDVTHVDTHKHTHMFPAIAEVAGHIAERCGVQPMRYPFEPRWADGLNLAVPLVRRLQLHALRRLEPAFRRLHRNRVELGLMPEGTLGIAATGSVTVPRLQLLLDTLRRHARPGEVYELCCHPGHHDAELDRQATRLKSTREVEYRALLAVLPEILRAEDAPALIHYGGLGIPGMQRTAGHFVPHNGFEKVL